MIQCSGYLAVQALPLSSQTLEASTLDTTTSSGVLTEVSFAEIITRTLTQEGFIDSKGNVNEKLLPPFPLIDKKQTTYLDQILKMERSKIVKLHSSDEKTLTFTLEELFIHLRKEYPHLKIQIFGSTLNSLISQCASLDVLFDVLKLSKQKDTLKEFFAKPPKDLDIRFVLSEEANTENILYFQQSINLFFLNKLEISNPRGSVKIYDDYVTPAFPSNFAIIGITAEEKETHLFSEVDLVITNKPKYCFVADALSLNVTGDTSNPYQFSCEGGYPLWQCFIDRITRCNRSYAVLPADNKICLFHLMKNQIEGFHFNDKKIEVSALSSLIAPKSTPGHEVIDSITLRKFEKFQKLFPIKGRLLAIQASIFLANHTKYLAISKLWETMQTISDDQNEVLKYVEKLFRDHPKYIEEVVFWLHLYALHLSTRPSENIKVFWSESNGVPSLEMQFAEGCLTLPVMPDQISFSHAQSRWKNYDQDKQAAFAPLLSCLFANNTEFPLSLEISTNIELTLNSYLKSYSLLQVEKVSWLSKEVNKEEMIQWIQHIKSFLMHQEVHFLISTFEEYLDNDTSSYPAPILWMQALVKSNDPSHITRSITLWDEYKNLLSEKDKKAFIDSLATQRIDLVLRLIDNERTLEFAEKFLPRNSLYHAKTLPWIAKKLSKPESLDKGLSCIQNSLFPFLFEHAQDESEAILRDIASKAIKPDSQKKLLDFIAEQFNAPSELTPLIAALLLSAYLSRQNVPVPARVQFFFKKYHEILSSNLYSTKILALWKWAQKNKVELKSLDHQVFIVALQIFVDKSKESTKEAKEIHLLFPLYSDSLLSAEITPQLQHTISEMQDLLMHHHMHKELLDWLRINLKWIKNQSSLEFRTEKTLALIGIIKQITLDQSDKKIIDDCLDVLSQINSDETEILDASAACYLTVLRNQGLQKPYKDEKFRALLHKKNENLLASFVSLIKTDVPSGLEALQTIAQDKQGNTDLEVLTIALSLLPLAPREFVPYWIARVANALKGTISSQKKDTITTVSQHLFIDASLVSTELIEGYIKHGIEIPDNLGSELKDNVFKLVFSKVSSSTTGQIIDYLDLILKQPIVTKDQDCFAIITQEVLKKATQPDSKSKTKNSIPKLNNWVRNSCLGKTLSTDLNAALKEYISFWGVEFHADFVKLSDELKIDQIIDQKALELHTEKLKKSEAEIAYNLFITNYPKIELMTLIPHGDYLSDKVMTAIYNKFISNEHSLDQLEQAFLFFENYNNFPLSSWNHLYKLTLDKIEKIGSSTHTVCKNSWRIFWSKLRLRYYPDSEYPINSTSSLWLLSIKIAIHGSNKEVLDILADHEKLHKLFSDSQLPRDVCLYVPSYLIVRLGQLLPMHGADRWREYYDNWHSFALRIVDFYNHITLTPEEHASMIDTMDLISLATSMVVARTGPDADFLLNQEIFCACLRKQLSNIPPNTLLLAASGLLPTLTGLVDLAMPHRRTMLIMKMFQEILPLTKDHQEIVIQYFDAFFINGLVDLTDTSIFEIITLIEADANPTTALANRITLAYFMIVRMICLKPSIQRTSQEQELLVSAIDMYVKNKSFVITNMGKHPYRYDWKSDPLVKELIESVNDHIQKLFLTLCFDLVVAQRAFFVSVITYNTIDVSHAIKYFEDLKLDDKVIKEFADLDIFSLFTLACTYPIPDGFKNTNWINIPKIFAHRLFEEAKTREIISNTPALHYQFGIGLDSPELIPDDISLDDIFTCTKTLLREDIFGCVFNDELMDKVKFLLGFPNEQNKWGKHKEKQVNALRNNPDEYFKLIGELISNLKDTCFFLNRYDYYYIPILEMVSLIRNDKTRLQETVNVLKNMLCPFSSVSLDIIIANSSVILVADSENEELVRRYDNQTMKDWLQLNILLEVGLENEDS